MLTARQRRYQHNKSGLRQVEIGDQSIHHLEAVARVNEDVCPAAGGSHSAILRRPALQCAAGRCANADHTAAVFLGFVDDIGSLPGDDAVFRMHLMLRDLVLFHRAEGAQTHMKGDIAQLDAHSLDLLQQLRGEVQSRRGGRRRADHLRINRLIALLILQFSLDIRRKRHPAQLLQNLKKDAFVLKMYQPVAIGQNLLHLRLKLTFSKGNTGTLAQLFARAHKTLPHVASLVHQQQDLHRAAGRTVADEPGRQHPGVIQHEAVPGAQELGQVIEMMVADLTGGLVQCHQPGAVPAVKWSLRNELLGQVIVKIACLHRMELPSFCIKYRRGA